MDCKTSSDNRETCINVTSSSCVAYMGYVSDSIKSKLPECKPNINDVLKAIQELLDKTIAGLGDNKTLDKKCLGLTPATDTQKIINQKLIDELCALKTQLGTTGGAVSSTSIRLAVNLLCLQDPACTPQSTYSLQELFDKLVTGYCNLLTRVDTIENVLNI